MRLSFYPRLAWDGIRKNAQLYLPYLLTCTGVVAVFYIIHYLAAMPVLEQMPGGTSAGMALGFGTWIVALFALLFLFYTNAFLIRRRQKEFGLYNILGMGKGNLSLLLLWETLILFAVSMTAGLALGIPLSGLAELGLIRVLGGGGYHFSIHPDALLDTFVIFVPIFALLYGRSLWQIWRLSAVALLRSESVGEKPPRANYPLGIAGLLILAGAYAIAVSIRSPLSALGWFFIAVGMVIVATYLLFLSGSVALCRLLQRHRGYYYQKDHFIAVSSMAYRMRRNGAGLASICILSTMVLVMMLGAGSLYFGAEDSLRAQYPHDLSVTARFETGDPACAWTAGREAALLEGLDGVLQSRGVDPDTVEHYLSLQLPGVLRDGALSFDQQPVYDTEPEACIVTFLSLADYNRCMGRSETLARDQVLLCSPDRSYDASELRFADGTVWQIRSRVETVMDGAGGGDLLPGVCLIVPELQAAQTVLGAELDRDAMAFYGSPQLYYGFDTDLPAAEELALQEALRSWLAEQSRNDSGGFRSYSTGCLEAQRSDFYGTYGGIFFLGCILSVVFLLATVLIVYYKQVTEGYEDERRFEIMRKVGMTTADIRRSVNAQMRTVFLLPLLTAVLHTCFAFPLIRKLLALFHLQNVPLMLGVMAVTVLAFGLFYALVYKCTSHVYFSIVSGRRAS